MDHGHCSLVQKLSPLNEVLFNFPRAVAKVVAGADSIFLPIPAQFLCFDRTNGGNESPVLLAMDVLLALRCRLIDQACAGGSATDAILFVELQIGEFEN